MSSGNELNNLDQAVIIALGSNLSGEYASLRDLLEAALDALERHGLHVVKRSGWWRSAAWPDPAAPSFLNGVALVETRLLPSETLGLLHQIEAKFGRRRMETNAPRTLDLDLIAFGAEISDSPQLPHPRAHDRRFVMGPLAEIAPGWRHPTLGRSASELATTATVGVDAIPWSAGGVGQTPV